MGFGNQLVTEGRAMLYFFLVDLPGKHRGLGYKRLIFWLVGWLVACLLVDVLIISDYY